MNRVEENAKVLKDMEKLSGDYDFHGSVLVFLDMMTTALLDISKSLAIVADSCDAEIMNEEKKDREPRQGSWIWETDEKIGEYCKCSICGIGMGKISFDYCPNCGAHMAEAVCDFEKDKS